MNHIIRDIHTHHPKARHAIISVSPEAFAPSKGLYYSVGIHPWDTMQPCNHALRALETLVGHKQVLAVGETGLDSMRGASLPEQERLFAAHIALAEQVGKPLVAHCVRSAQQLVGVWRRTAPHRVPLAIHGFRGNERVAITLLKAGFYLSFGARFNSAALAVTPAHRLLLETDEATISINEVAAQVAEVLCWPVDDVLTTVAANISRFISCDPL